MILAGRAVSQSSLQAVTNEMESSLHNQTLISEISQTVQAAVEAGEEPYAARPMPVGVSVSESWNATLGAHVGVIDRVTGFEYLPIISGPYLLTKTVLEDARYVERVPGFVGGGITVSFW
jgi:hypothetical protein